VVRINGDTVFAQGGVRVTIKTSKLEYSVPDEMFQECKSKHDEFVSAISAKIGAGIQTETGKPGQVETILVTPQDITLNMGTTQQFKATGYDADGNEVKIEPVWRLATTEQPYGDIGTLSPTGLFEAKRIGKGEINVVVNNILLSNKAKVAVRCNPDIPGDLEKVKQLYKQKIPEGPVSVALKSGKLPPSVMDPLLNFLSVFKSGTKPGIVNNMLATYSVGHRKYFENWACGSYQGRVLEFLDELKSDAKTCTLLNGFKYGPIQAYKGGHQAVVIYPIHADWRKTGTVLDPWPEQDPKKRNFYSSSMA